jgi:hypothetical protein
MRLFGSELSIESIECWEKDVYQSWEAFLSADVRPYRFSLADISMRGGKFGIVMVADLRSDRDSADGVQIDAKNDRIETKLLVLVQS